MNKLDKQTFSRKLYDSLVVKAHFIVDIIENISSDFNNGFNELYFRSKEENYFWEYCPFGIYESNYGARFHDFKSVYPDIKEEEFITQEIKSIEEQVVEIPLNILSKKGIDSDTGFIHSYVINDSFGETIPLKLALTPEIYIRISFSQNRKLEFLNNKLEEINELITTNEDDIASSCEEFIDSLGVKRDLAQVFVEMYELRLFDHLDDLSLIHLDQSKKARILSSISGIKLDNLRKMYNGSLNKDRNNKLTEERIINAHAKLSSFGLDPNKLKSNQLKK